MRSSSTADAYIRQITDVDAALKRLNAQTKELRKKKKDAQTRLHAWMEKNKVDEYGKISIKKIAPKPPAKRKPAKKKKDDALRLFTAIGVNDPEELWEEFQRTQKVISEPIEEPDADAQEGEEDE
jgi:hypothetical protein